MSQRGGGEAEGEGLRRLNRRWPPATLLAEWTRRSQRPQRAASSAKQKKVADSLLQTSHCIFILGQIEVGMRIREWRGI